MQAVDLAALTRDAMLVTLKLAGPPLLTALVVGLFISVLQAVTQIHEATLAFVPKLLALGVMLLLAGPFMTGMLLDFSRMMFDRMVVVGGS
jgi:flagellar biosynthetic protein FliQ